MDQQWGIDESELYGGAYDMTFNLSPALGARRMLPFLPNERDPPSSCLLPLGSLILPYPRPHLQHTPQSLRERAADCSTASPQKFCVGFHSKGGRARVNELHEWSSKQMNEDMAAGAGARTQPRKNPKPKRLIAPVYFSSLITPPCPPLELPHSLLLIHN